MSTTQEQFDYADKPRSKWFSLTYLQYYCSISGVICSLLFFVGLLAAGFVPPPIKPTWTADQVVTFYREHLTGIQAGAALIMIGGMFYLPFSAAISYQISTIRGLPTMIHQMQLAAAAAGVFTFIMPGIVLATTAYRLDRPADITQALNDLFWISCLITWPTFMVQGFAYAYAICFDRSPDPLFPRWIAVFNIAVPIIYTPATGLHCVMGGPLAWDGVWTFWINGVLFCVEILVESVLIFLAARKMARRQALQGLKGAASSLSSTGVVEP